MNRFTVCFIVCLFGCFSLVSPGFGCLPFCYQPLFLDLVTVLWDPVTLAQLGGLTVITEEPSDKGQVRCTYMN